MSKTYKEKKREKEEDILFESLNKIFDLNGGEIQFDELAHIVLVRVTNEMLNENEYPIDWIKSKYRSALVQCLNYQKEDIDEEIQKINQQIKEINKDAKTH